MSALRFSFSFRSEDHADDASRPYRRYSDIEILKPAGGEGGAIEAVDAGPLHENLGVGDAGFAVDVAIGDVGTAGGS